MKLTPIKVRGKRGQPKIEKLAKRAIHSAKESQEADDQLAPEIKRAKINHHQVVGAAGVDANSNSRPKRRRALPRLSQLPQEIIERVFIASRNLSLPLVNRELHHRLSSNSVRYQLVGAAFGPTWDAWYGLENSEVQSYDGWMADADRIAGDPTFQSAILACPWAKLPMLLESFNVWIRQHANGRRYFSFPVIQKIHMHGLEAPAEEEKEEENLIFSDMESKFNYDMGFFASKSSNELLRGTCQSGADFEGIAVNCRALLGQHLEVNPGTQIPEDLLGGPFFLSDESEQESGSSGFHVDSEKYERLFWLVRGGACLQEQPTWEVSRDGFRAILELIIQVDRRKDAIKSRHAEDPTNLPTEGILKIAVGIFILFDILGVFSNEWPKWILQTSLAEVIRLIPTVAPKSAPELLLGNIACALRYALRTGTTLLYELTGCRWRRPFLRPKLAKINAQPDLLELTLMGPRPHAYYRVGWHRALYLDSALTINRMRLRERDGEETSSGGGGVEEKQAVHRVSRPKVHRAGFEAYMTAVGVDIRLVRNDRDEWAPERPWVAAAFQPGWDSDEDNGRGEATSSQAVPLDITAHEPWSDYGLE